MVRFQSFLSPVFDSFNYCCCICIIGVCRKHAGARVFQEGQEEERLPHTFIQFQEEIEIVR